MIDTGLVEGISARLVVGGGRGGRMRGAISRSLVVVVMGLGVEGRLGGAPLLAGSTGPVEGGTGVGSTAMGVVVSRGDSIGKSDAAEGISEAKSARGGMACVKADTVDVLCGGEGSVVAGAGMGAVGAAGRVVAEKGSGKGVAV